MREAGGHHPQYFCEMWQVVPGCISLGSKATDGQSLLVKNFLLSLCIFPQLRTNLILVYELSHTQECLHTEMMCKLGMKEKQLLK